MTLIEDLRSAVGDSAVKTDPALLAPFLLDNRRRFHGSVLCAVYPKSTEDTAAVMNVCVCLLYTSDAADELDVV